MELENRLSVRGKVKVHIISDDCDLRNKYSQMFQKAGYDSYEFDSPAKEIRHSSEAHVVIVGRDAGGIEKGYFLAEKIHKKYKNKKPVILMEEEPKIIEKVRLKDFKKEKFLAGKFYWGNCSSSKSEVNLCKEIDFIVDVFYSMKVFLVGNPEWTIEHCKDIIEVKPKLYCDLEEVLNNIERARGIIIGCPVARYHSVGSKKVSENIALSVLRKKGYSGVVQAFSVESSLSKEKLLDVVQKMA